MATSVLNLFRKSLGKVLLALSFLAAGFAQAQGPISGYTYLGSCTDINSQPHYYYVSTAALTWPAANSAATTLGGYLATLTSAAENNCVTTALVAAGVTSPNGDYDNNNNPWIGLNDAANESVFTWANGENCAPNFRNWDAGEPNNFGPPPGEDYVQLLTFNTAQRGKWNDWFSDRTQRYILEFGPNTCVTIPPCTLTVSVSLPALSCDGPNVIYLGYGTQSVTATSNQTGTTFQWFMVGNSTPVANGATFTPTATGTYYVVATNGRCTASTLGKPSQITVIDVRCDKDGKKPHKIYVCHKKNGTNGNGTIGDNAHTLCVDASAVPAHLA
ncbi:MAG TPA: lectin-like protein, partial [Flavisolibacter sp.]|nr:lectin-like protein [Flavisolibacter sp.]